MLEKSILSCVKGEFLSVTTLVSADKVSEDLAKRGFPNGNPMVGRITKEVSYGSVRICDYEKLADVIAEREQGKEAKKPWYDWEEDKFPYIAKGRKSGLRYFVVKPTKKTTYNTKWFLDGVEVSLDTIKPYFKASTFNRGEDEPRMFTLQLEFITYLKQKDIIFKR